MAENRHPEGSGCTSRRNHRPDEFLRCCSRSSSQKQSDPRSGGGCVQTLAEQVLKERRGIRRRGGNHRGSSPKSTKLTEQINLILHHEDFQRLEGSWRGLHHLVNNTGNR